MKVNKHNAEGYKDLTAFEAMTSILKEQAAARTAPRKYMPRVFISSPFAGEVETNVQNARRYCAFAVKNGYIPYAPHLFFPQFMDDTIPEQRELGMFMGKVFLDGCKELWAFGDRISPGMSEEISRAKERGIIIRYFTDDCEEV